MLTIRYFFYYSHFYILSRLSILFYLLVVVILTIFLSFFYNQILKLAAMKALLPFLISVLLQISLNHKTYSCEFHKYQHSNHYKTKVLPATHLLQNHKHK